MHSKCMNALPAGVQGSVINIHEAIPVQGQHVADDGFSMCGRGEKNDVNMLPCTSPGRMVIAE